MKSIIYLFTIIILLTLSSSECEDKIRFKNPQPAKTKNRSVFDLKIQGVYVPVNVDFYSFEDPGLKELTDTLSAILNIHINIKDTSTITISENQIIRRNKEDLILGKEYFGDYFKKIRHLNTYRFLESIISTNEFNDFFDPDTVYYQDNVICLIVGSDTIELHPMENAFYAVANHDTVVSIFFSKYHIDGVIVLDSSLVKIQINDSSILISADDSAGGINFHGGVYYTDTTLLIITDNDTMAQAFITENELCINLPNKALDCPIISGKIYINLQNKVETLFCITDKCILRELNNSYYLNRLRGKNDSCYWSVSQLRLDNDVLALVKQLKRLRNFVSVKLV